MSFFASIAAIVFLLLPSDRYRLPGRRLSHSRHTTPSVSSVFMPFCAYCSGGMLEDLGFAVILNTWSKRIVDCKKFWCCNSTSSAIFITNNLWLYLVSSPLFVLAKWMAFLSIYKFPACTRSGRSREQWSCITPLPPTNRPLVKHVKDGQRGQSSLFLIIAPGPNFPVR